MTSNEMYTLGTNVYYAGEQDIALCGGFGRITDVCNEDIEGELIMTITMEDGRIIHNITVADFEPITVWGNTQPALMQMMDEAEQDGLTDNEKKEYLTDMQLNDILAYMY